MGTTNYGLPDQIYDLQLDQPTLIANTGFEIVSATDGYIKELRSSVQAAITTGGTLTVFVNGVQVTGIALVVANGAAKGVRGVSAATKGTTVRKVSKGDRIEVRTAGFATAGSLFATLTVEAADNSPQPGYAS